ncbi:MAG: DUF4173 domain-containing protein [Candidatus Spechtbacterales bacterium]
MATSNPSQGNPKAFGLIFVVSILLGILFKMLVQDNEVLGISFPLFVGLAVATGLGLAAFFKHPLKRSTYVLLVPVAFFPLMAVVRDSGFLSFLSVAATIYLILTVVYNEASESIARFSLDKYLRVPTLPIVFGVMFLRFIGHITTLRLAEHKRARGTQVATGVAIALPFLILFTMLFASADLVFQNYLNNLFNVKLDLEGILPWIPTFVVAALFMGAFSYIFQPTPSTPKEGRTEPAPKRTLGMVEASIVLSSIATLFLAVIALQITYLFGGEANITAQGFTYAEYARRGFFELLAVTLISLAMLYIINRSVGPRTKKEHKHFSLLSVVLLGELGLLIVSAAYRLLLYVDAFGLTEQRFYSLLFIIWVGVAAALFGFTLIRQRAERAFAFELFLLGVAFVAFANIINPDAIIARYNIQNVPQEEGMDAYYLTLLSHDATPHLIELLEDESLGEENRRIVAEELKWRLDNLRYEVNLNDWRGWNLSRMRAEQLLEEHQHLLPEGSKIPGQ